MPKIAKEMGALEVGRLKAVGFHAVGGVSGLGLQIVESGARSWVLRTMVGSKRRKMGLGGFPDVPLAMAKEKARQAKLQIHDGDDPIDERNEKRKALSASRSRDVTFKKCAEDYITAHSPTWKNPKHAGQWTSTLEAYAYPVIGDMWARDIGLGQIMQILEPIWLTKTETAKRLRGRIESVLDSATTKGLRSGTNPARWRGNLSTVLPQPSKVKKTKHFKALKVEDMGAFMKKLRQQDGMSARALEYLILTNVRSHNVRHGTKPEVDYKTKTWAIPGEDDEGTGQRMKTGIAHRVPLSTQAIQLLKSMPDIAGPKGAPDLLFRSPRKGVQLSDMAMNKLLRDMGVDAVPHGFRSTFRNWAMDYTNFQGEIAEKAMAHAVGDKTEQAYLRSDAFNKRRRMMQAWADFCDVVRNASGKVVPIRAA